MLFACRTLLRAKTDRGIAGRLLIPAVIAVWGLAGEAGGYNYLGTTTPNTADAPGANVMNANQFTASASFTAATMKFRVNTAAGNISLAIYSDNADQPNTKLGETNSVAATTGWMSIPLQSSVSIVNSTKYWLCVNYNNASLVAYMDFGAGGIQYYNAYTFGSWPSSYGAVTPPADDGRCAIQVTDSGGQTPRKLYWHGATSDFNTLTNWKTDQGGTTSATYRIYGDTLLFNGSGTNSDANCTMDANDTCKHLDFTGYTGTFNIASYTLACSTNVTFVAGMNVTYGTGTLMFIGTSGSHTFIPPPDANDSLYNVTFNGSGGSWSISTNDLDVKNDLTITAGTFTVGASRSVNVTGDLIVAGTLTATSATAINVDDSVYITGTLTAPSSGTFTVARGWRNNAGTFTHSSGTVTFDGATANCLILSGGTGAGKTFYNLTINGSGSADWTINTSDMTVSNNLTISGRTLTVPSSRTLTVSATLGVTGGTLTATDGLLNCDDSVKITSGILTAPTGASNFTLSGSWIKTGGTFTPGGGTVTFDGTGTKYINSGGTSFSVVTFNGSGSTWNALTNDITATGLVTITAGTLDISANSKKLTSAGLTINGGTLTATNGTVNNTGDFTLSSGTFTAPNSAADTVAGAWAVSGSPTFTPGAAGTVVFTATSAKNLNSGAKSFTNIIFAGSGGTWSLLTNDLTATGTIAVNSGTLSVTSGRQVTPTGGLTVNSGGTLAGVGTVAGAVTVNSGGTVSPGTDATAATLTCTGNITMASGATYSAHASADATNDKISWSGTGTCNLASATLSMVLGYGPSTGHTFRVIDNTSTGTISNQFSCGTSAMAAYGGVTYTFSVNYSGGTGNDVVLTYSGMLIDTAMMVPLKVRTSATKDTVYNNRWSLVFDPAYGGGITWLSDDSVAGGTNEVPSGRTLFYIDYNGVASYSQAGTITLLERDSVVTKLRQAVTISSQPFFVDYAVHGCGRVYVRVWTNGQITANKTLKFLTTRENSGTITISTKTGTASSCPYILLADDAIEKNDLIFAPFENLGGAGSWAFDTAYANPSRAGWTNTTYSLAANKREAWEFMIDFGRRYSNSISTTTDNVATDYRTSDSLQFLAGYLSAQRAWELNLAGHWSFDENTSDSVRDISGNNRAGKLTNGGTWVTGRFGYADSVDGTDSVIISDNDAFDADGDFTIMAWVKPKTALANNTLIMKKGSESAGTITGWKLDGSGGALRFIIGNGTAAVTVTGATSLGTGSWKHVAIRGSNNTDSIMVFIDGKCDIYSTSAYSVGTNTNPLVLGKGLDGVIDDVRMYNWGLSDAYIRSIFLKGYNPGSGELMTRVDDNNTLHLYCNTGGITRYFPVFKMYNYWSTDGTPNCVYLNSTSLGNPSDRYVLSFSDAGNSLSLGLDTTLTASTQIFVDDEDCSGTQLVSPPQPPVYIAGTDSVVYKNFSGNTLGSTDSNHFALVIDKRTGTTGGCGGITWLKHSKSSASESWMAATPAVLGSVSSVATNGSASTTLSHAVSSGSNLVLVVCVGFEGTPPTTVSSITYGGTSLTQAKRQLSSSATNPQACSEVWYLSAPTVGTADVVVTLGASVNHGVGAITLENASQAGPEHITGNWGEGIGVEVSTTSTAYSTPTIIISGASCTGTNPFTPGSGQTEHYDLSPTGVKVTADSKQFGSRGSQTMTITSTVTGTQRMSMASVLFGPPQLLVGGSMLNPVRFRFNNSASWDSTQGGDVVTTANRTVTVAESSAVRVRLAVDTVKVRKGGSDITIGTTTLYTNNEDPSANTLVTNVATLSQTATINSLSICVAGTPGNIRLGIYDNTGPSGKAGAVKAQTNSTAASVGWQTINVVTPVSLAAGTYYLAMFTDNASYMTEAEYTGTTEYYTGQTYGSMPSLTATSPTGTWVLTYSFYATLTPPGDSLVFGRQYTIYPDGKIFTYFQVYKATAIDTMQPGLALANIGSTLLTPYWDNSSPDTRVSGFYHSSGTTVHGAAFSWQGYQSKSTKGTATTSFVQDTAYSSTSTEKKLFQEERTSGNYDAADTTYRLALYYDIYRDFSATNQIDTTVRSILTAGSALRFITGTPDTSDFANGDLDSNGFNEAEGCWVMKASGNSIHIRIDGATWARFNPAFKINSYTSVLKPQYVFLYRSGGDTLRLNEGYQYTMYHDKANKRLVMQLDTVIRDSTFLFLSVDPTMAVTMDDFRASGGDGRDTVFWTTQSEEQNRGFILYRRIKPEYLDSLALAASKAVVPDSEADAVTLLYKRSRISYADTNWIPVFEKIIPGAPGGRSFGTRNYRVIDRYLRNDVAYQYRIESLDYENKKEAWHGIAEARPMTQLPGAFLLHRNYPNPFKAYTTIRYDLPIASRVRINIYSMQGRVVRQLLRGDQRQNAGFHRVVWNGTDDFGRRLPPGPYIYQFVAGKYRKAMVMMVLR